MNPELPVEARELAAAADRAFADLGGVDVARRAEADPAVRVGEVAPLLVALGAEDIDPRADDVALASAAALCEAAGRVGLPYPLAAALLRDADGHPTAAVAPGAARVDHGDVFARWRVGALDGSGGVGAPTGRVGRGRLGPFVVDLELAPDGRPAPLADVLLHLLLTAWAVIGTLDRAVELAAAHVSDRQQFGRPLAEFQAVRFQLADASVAVAGLRELAGFTLWRWHTDRAGARPDVVALRLHGQEVARAVLRTAQQLHGAAGVCEEYDVSVLARTVQPALRLAGGVDRSSTDLLAAVTELGFDGLFPHGADLAAAPSPSRGNSPRETGAIASRAGASGGGS